MSHSQPSLFTPVELGDLTLPNRIVMAPLTRCRATNHQPNELMAQYYAQRASAGLLITECTMVSEGTSAFGNDPGIYSNEQVAGWKMTTDAVHTAGGRIFMQIWHAGRAAHPLFNDGQPSFGPSAIAIDGVTHTPEGKQPYSVPQELTKDQIRNIVKDFRQGAENAKLAGFDGVEIHGANGYLIDQFLRDSSNQRTDEYGGSMANRVRFLGEVIEAVSEVFGSGRVGLRLSPINGTQSMCDSDPIGWTEFLANYLNQFDLAYLHVMRADFLGIQKADVLSVARNHYKGHLMVNMGYDVNEANDEIANNDVQTIAFGKLMLANPDFVERAKMGAEFNVPNKDTFYTSGAEGYIDYPTLASA
ncbi:alkene reductase [Marinomonas piezotolerans]|uniref:Alkene reductase n=1 Tax=Marinomonas piezotolerans TaxID=2213058 RepID=A0A370UE31_9GAMM|nr:alkene reductase [Marinomonas piezotolerans]RDL46042.1 alkene reductase [Marinomonas piezotolerans]